MTNVEALKILYQKLGGDITVVSLMNTTVELLKAISEIYDKNSIAMTNSAAILDLSNADIFTNDQLGSLIDRTITTISIPEIDAVGDYVFAFCRNLAEINFEAPEKINTIGKYAFAYNAFTALDLSESAGLNLIDDYAFQNCSISNIKLPINVNGNGYALGNSAFRNTALTTLDLRGCAQLKTAALKDAPITSVYFDKLSTVAASVFSTGTSTLTDIYYTGTQAEWESISGMADAGIGVGVTIHYEYTPE